MVLCHYTHQAQFHVRIAELEAELAALRGTYIGRGHEDTCQYLRRAEKAEAEVERLRRIAKEHDYCPDWNHHADFPEASP